MGGTSNEARAALRKSGIAKRPGSESKAALNGQVHSLRISEIERDPDLQIRFSQRSNGSRQESSVDQLADDIRRNGQLMPVCVFERKKGDAVAFVLVDGHRRLAALEALKRPSVKAVVIKASAKDALRCAFSLNHSRKNLRPLDVANAIVLARKQGWSKDEIKKAFGLERSQIDRYQHLLDCPAAVKERLVEGRISMAQALAILEASRDDGARAVQVLERTLVDDLSARKISKVFIGHQRRSRKLSRKSLVSVNDGRVHVRRLVISVKHSPQDLSWAKAELAKAISEVEKLEKLVQTETATRRTT